MLAPDGTIVEGLFAICPRGHVFESLQHVVVKLCDGFGKEIKRAIVCSECQFDFFSQSFPAVILPKGTSRKEAEWKAKEMKEETIALVEGVIDENGKVS